MIDAVIEYSDITALDLVPAAIDAVLQRNNIKVMPHASFGEKIYALFEELVESKLLQPTFIVGFPIEVSPLTKRDSNNPLIAPRYELFIAGMEIANSYNELNDPFDQASGLEISSKRMRLAMKKLTSLMLTIFVHSNMACRRQLALG